MIGANCAGLVLGDKYHFVLVLKGLPKMTNPSGARSTHWRVVKAERDHWKNLVACHGLSHRPLRPLKKAVLCLTRLSSVRPDSDGLVSSFKAVIDGLVLGRVLVNDGWDNIGMPDYRWEKATPGQGGIRIELTAILSDMISDGEADEFRKPKRNRIKLQSKRRKISPRHP
jgi:hypothetical protein